MTVIRKVARYGATLGACLHSFLCLVTRRPSWVPRVTAALFAVIATAPIGWTQGDFQALRYHPSTPPVDLGVGLWAWPLPFDYDGDGDYDLVVSCPDTPFRGLYWFENPTGRNNPMPVFRAPVKIGNGLDNVTLCRRSGHTKLLTPATRWTLSAQDRSLVARRFFPTTNVHANRVRANQWCEVDYDGDGDQDLVIGVGDWTEYGWDNAYAPDGTWRRGPLHGYVYLVVNRGDDARPRYAPPTKILAGGRPIDVYGRPSPQLDDFDGDGDLDLICGEFLDGLHYFANIGSRTQPVFDRGRRIREPSGRILKFDLQMIVPSAIDWDEDGDVDLVVGDEDGRVAWCEHTGVLHHGVPVFQPPKYLRQQPGLVKFGALATPFAVDWDGDGDEDLISGNSAGYIAFLENLDGNDPPRLAPPKRLCVDGEPIRIMAGPNGSIQGPAEAKWGYTTLSVADWDGDSLPDLIVNSILGRVVWYRNSGSRTRPQLAPPEPVRVAWPSDPPYPSWNWWRPAREELVTQWRTTPFAIDWDRDGLCDLVMLDHEGYLAWYRRIRTDQGLRLTPGRRVFTDQEGKPLKLSLGDAGRSGRRKLTIADWNRDGLPDLMMNSGNVDLLPGLARTSDGGMRFGAPRAMASRKLAGHTTSPTVVDWNGDGRLDLVVGAEDGHFYYLRQPPLP